MSKTNSVTNTGAWLTFTLATKDDDAKKRYLQRYGTQPEHLIRELGLLWLGPIPTKGSEK